MNEVKFNTQICTTREQSKLLLSMGLNPETADMIHFFDDRDDYQVYHRWVCRPWKWNEEDLVDSDNIPAWSLHGLIELLPRHIRLSNYADTLYWLVIDPLKVIYKNSHGLWIYQCDEGGLYDKLINTIEWTIKNNHFNKEYLKQ